MHRRARPHEPTATAAAPADAEPGRDVAQAHDPQAPAAASGLVPPRALEELMRMQAILELLHDLVFVVTAAGEVVYASASVATVLGFRPQDVLHRKLVEFSHPDDAVLLRATLHRLLRPPAAPAPDLAPSTSVASLGSAAATTASLAADHFQHTVRLRHRSAPTHALVSIHGRCLSLAALPAAAAAASAGALSHPLLHGFRGTAPHPASFAHPLPHQLSAGPASPTAPAAAADPFAAAAAASRSPEDGPPLILLVGRPYPLPPHDTLLDELLELQTENLRLRALLSARYSALGASPAEHSTLREVAVNPMLFLAPRGTARGPDSPLVPAPRFQVVSAADPDADAAAYATAPLDSAPASALPAVPLRPPRGSRAASAQRTAAPALLRRTAPPALIDTGPEPPPLPPPSAAAAAPRPSTAHGAAMSGHLPAMGQGSGLAGVMSPSDYMSAKMASTPATADASGALATDPSKKRRKRSRPKEGYVCMDCGTDQSPEWRRGPNGEKCLCNACGLRFAKRKRQDLAAAAAAAALSGASADPDAMAVDPPPIRVLLPQLPPRRLPVTSPRVDDPPRARADATRVPAPGPASVAVPASAPAPAPAPSPAPAPAPSPAPAGGELPAVMSSPTGFAHPRAGSMLSPRSGTATPRLQSPVHAPLPFDDDMSSFTAQLAAQQHVHGHMVGSSNLGSHAGSAHSHSSSLGAPHSISTATPPTNPPLPPPSSAAFMDQVGSWMLGTSDGQGTSEPYSATSPQVDPPLCDDGEGGGNNAFGVGLLPLSGGPLWSFPSAALGRFERLPSGSASPAVGVSGAFGERRQHPHRHHSPQHHHQQARESTTASSNSSAPRIYSDGASALFAADQAFSRPPYDFSHMLLDQHHQPPQHLGMRDSATLDQAMGSPPLGEDSAPHHVHTVHHHHHHHHHHAFQEHHRHHDMHSPPPGQPAHLGGPAPVGPSGGAMFAPDGSLLDAASVPPARQNSAPPPRAFRGASASAGPGPAYSPEVAPTRRDESGRAAAAEPASGLDDYDVYEKMIAIGFRLPSGDIPTFGDFHRAVRTSHLFHGAASNPSQQQQPQPPLPPPTAPPAVQQQQHYPAPAHGGGPDATPPMSPHHDHGYDQPAAPRPRSRKRHRPSGEAS
ncbi:hypothetical protein H9P43_008017 [Blastocladiella emersonii ATCC 22665]|nr:hypothetical protein H9P43_008017 [Blastocladiella emersonii ATCC 22665]